MINEKIFKAYDIRGVYPEEINEETVYLTAKAYAEWLKPKKVALGRDVRTSGESLFEEAKRGLIEMGVDVVEMGVITTDMLYFAVANYGFDGGISMTASHNSAEYNGMKMVKEKSEPISLDSGLAEIRDIAQKGDFSFVETTGKVEVMDVLGDYVEKVMFFVDTTKIRPLKVVANPNFGAAGKVADQIATKLNIEVIELNYEENGDFPKGRPDPLIEENRKETSELVKKEGADFGVAWDADADRCFFFDENGNFVDGYYISAVLAEIVLGKYPGSKIIHDPRLTWAIVDKVKSIGGIPIESKIGHSFIKARMKKEDAAFGGENSGHYYFKDFYFCDNGMIPFVLILQKLSVSGKKLSELVNPLRKKYPISGEINFKVADVKAVLLEIGQKYSDGKAGHIDGVSVEYPDWRFNVRGSNTEPLVRLNIEAKTKELVDEKVRELTGIIEG